MARARVIRKEDKCYLELPAAFLQADSVEVFPLRDGYYLLSVALGHGTEWHEQPKSEDQKSAQQRQIILNPEERAVLAKLLGIRFEKRTPEIVQKHLDDQEKKVLAGLEKKRYINVFKGRKYSNGVYNINDRIYPYINMKPETTLPTTIAQPKEKAAETKAQVQQKPAVAPKGLYDALMEQGFLVIANKEDARLLSERLESDMKKGEVKGMKGFDGKFYVATKKYITKASGVIMKKLEHEMALDEIAEETKIPRDGCMVIMQMLAEEGEVIEKKRGIFVKV